MSISGRRSATLEANQGVGGAPTPDRAWIPMGQQCGLPAARATTKQEVLGAGMVGPIHSACRVTIGCASPPVKRCRSAASTQPRFPLLPPFPKLLRQPNSEPPCAAPLISRCCCCCKTTATAAHPMPWLGPCITPVAIPQSWLACLLGPHFCSIAGLFPLAEDAAAAATAALCCPPSGAAKT